MKKLWKQFRIGSVIMSACMLVIGILMVVWPGISALAICYLFGAACLLTGLYSLLRHFRLGQAGLFFNFDLTFGICCCLAGLLLLVHPYGVVSLLPIAVGLYMIISGIAALQTALEMRRYNYRSWGVSLILSVLTILIAVFLFLNPFKGAEAFMIFIGIALIINAVQRIYSLVTISRAVERFDDEDDVIDVDWTWRE